MGTYSQSSLDLVCRLIHRDNPQIETPLSSENVMLLGGPFTSGLGSSGRNTRVLLNGKTGSGIVGKKEFFYDRIDIGKLFNGITVVFTAKGEAATVVDLLPALNEQYGLGLTAEDITNGSTKLGTGYSPTPVTITIASTSVAYRGSLSVIWTRQPVGVYPDSGPGSKVLLVGSLNEGYFGIVQEAELFNPLFIHSKLNEGQATPIGTPTSQPANRYWYKFVRDSKILYLANYNHMNVRWQDLYSRGAAYETDQPTDKQFPADGNIVAQRFAIKKAETGRDWYLSPCMPRLSTVFPWDYEAANQTPDPTGDVARLFAKIVASTGFATGEWDSQSIDAGGFWFSTTSEKDPTKAFGSNMVGINQNVYDKATYNGGWRPMLELIDLDAAAVPLEDFMGVPDGVLRKPLFTISPDTGEVLLIVNDISWEVSGALRKPLLSMDPSPLMNVNTFGWHRLPETRPVPVRLTPDTPSPLGTYGWSKLLRAPVAQITSEYKEATAVDLSTADGELDGFN
ncbi:putative virion structural protein [Erwinia phage vB_EamM_Phobos]|uniref:virion structural protein n=1 Tax=Erwinia phage vB_EamM_Phobos TaxID=1883377 RepID=UPI00081C95E7|nr:virion structural protein [Erwinia phage vB_EamM_Phobos]ANZ50342.1 putative virion structural protein [Erwinia phage vB_EamM_Phobos]